MSSRKQLEFGSYEKSINGNPEEIRGGLFSILISYLKRSGSRTIIERTSLADNKTESIHCQNSSTAQLSCQIAYLKRVDAWERGVLDIPYQTWTDKSASYFPSENRVFFDLETYYLPQDLGYSRAYANLNRPEVLPKQRLGLAVTIDDAGKVGCWDECQASQLIDYLLKHDQIVSYNGLNFDNFVLSAYSSREQFQQLMTKTFDLYVHLQEIRGFKRRLIEWSHEYTGSANYAKILISQGFGFEEGKLVEGFNAQNSIPLILRKGAAAQKRLVWAACFEDAYNTRAVLTELSLEQRLKNYES